MSKSDQGTEEYSFFNDRPCEDPIRFSAERILALVDRIEKDAVCRDCQVAILRDIAADLNSIA